MPFHASKYLRYCILGKRPIFTYFTVYSKLENTYLICAFIQVDLDKTSETLMTTTQQLEEKEKALLGAELEVS